MKEEKTMGKNNTQDDLAFKPEDVETAKDDEASKDQNRERQEITLKFGKGCVGDEFTGKDGKSYREILIPNADPNDKTPWQTFVLRSNQVHENQFGKGMWCKLPADGMTTIQRSVKVGQDENGKNIWQKQWRKVSNTELKKMVESYKERTPMKDKLAQKKEESARINKPEPDVAKGKDKAMAI